MMRTFTCRVGDIRRVAITCRCRIRSVAEVPQQLAMGYMVHPCPSCGALFEVHQNDAGKWEIKKLPGNVKEMDSAYTIKRDEPSPVGTRVQILDDDPRHNGKLGFITKRVEVAGHSAPIITLDDGTELGGWECWWKPIETGREN